jgi:hypothetical protein
VSAIPPKKRTVVRALLQPHLYGIRRHFANCHSGYFRVGNYWKCRQCLRWMPRGFEPPRARAFDPLACVQPGKQFRKYPPRKPDLGYILDLLGDGSQTRP